MGDIVYGLPTGTSFLLVVPSNIIFPFSLYVSLFLLMAATYASKGLTSLLSVTVCRPSIQLLCTSSILLLPPL